MSTPALFKPIKVGKLTLAHRIAMAPLTRSRATNPELAPTSEIARFYAQRACEPGTLLIAEATYVSERGSGIANLPGIWTPAQIAGWREVTAAVHARGSHIYLQLWALGRCASKSYLRRHGLDLVAPSARPDSTGGSLEFSGEAVDPGDVGAVPRALKTAEVREYVEEFAQAARNAVEQAGFDGVEIHAANGYLLEQFLKECANGRTDEYGGSVENRARFTLEVVDAVAGAIGAHRTGIRLSPLEHAGGMELGAGTLEQYAHVLRRLEERRTGRLAYVHTVENVRFVRNSETGARVLKRPLEFVRSVWTGVWIRTQGFDAETAMEFANEDDKLIIGFGRGFLATPDLVRRIRDKLPWNELDESTYYIGGPRGFTDYPFYEG